MINGCIEIVGSHDDVVYLRLWAASERQEYLGDAAAAYQLEDYCSTGSTGNSPASKAGPLSNLSLSFSFLDVVDDDH